ncbi:hypothetical protein JMA_33690 [Jeotgalibacillus malaysiensis]|uniref:Aldolase n=1 Tax=Jeotgalibacillus malaysiensis TaxID=1508404 RepID=A0A0B5ARI0_9BACL|nr:hypothetical protein [Jeotgalibacillus malaysiensis]AJD92686.1 hypothetical protein JMA_33690 [Jeotgalibacillus malaysiensis]
MEIQTKIGTHSIRIYSTDQEVIRECSTVFSFMPFKTDQHDLEITIFRGHEKPFTSYDVKVNGKSGSIIYQRDDFTITVDPSYTRAEVTVHSPLALKHSIMTLYSGLIAHQNWGILLHSSCVLDDQNAHIFTGRSGAGKSTAAQLSMPRPLLSDEATLIKIHPEEGVFIYHSPFRSELMETAGAGPYSLKSLNLLHQSPDNHRMEMGKAQAFILLMDKVFYWSMNKEDVKKITSMLQQMISQTEVYHLYFKKDPTFWELMTS